MRILSAVRNAYQAWWRKRRYAWWQKRGYAWWPKAPARGRASWWRSLLKASWWSDFLKEEEDAPLPGLEPRYAARLRLLFTCSVVAVPIVCIAKGVIYGGNEDQPIPLGMSLVMAAPVVTIVVSIAWGVMLDRRTRAPSLPISIAEVTARVGESGMMPRSLLARYFRAAFPPDEETAFHAEPRLLAELKISGRAFKDVPLEGGRVRVRAHAVIRVRRFRPAECLSEGDVEALAMRAPHVTSRQLDRANAPPELMNPPLPMKLDANWPYSYSGMLGIFVGYDPGARVTITPTGVYVQLQRAPETLADARRVCRFACALYEETIGNDPAPGDGGYRTHPNARAGDTGSAKTPSELEKTMETVWSSF
jgi:hypothetical protein